MKHNKIRKVHVIALLLMLPAFGFAENQYNDPADNIPSLDFNEAEGWFEVDGIEYHIIDGTSTCEVGDYYNREINFHNNGRYSGVVEIPSKVTHDGIEYDVVGIRAFDYCDDLREVKIPSSIRYIDGFNGTCDFIRSLVIPEGVEKISGFSCGMALTDLEFPASLKEISTAISYYQSLERLTVHNETPVDVDEYTFYNCNQEICTLIVPKGCVEAYSKAPGWRNFGKITDSPEAPYISQEKDVEVISAGGLDYVITGEGECALVDRHDYDIDYWYFYKGDITIPWFVTQLYNDYLVNAIVAFRWSDLKSVEISPYVEYIDGFKSIRGLESLTIPNNVATVKGISHCNALKEIVLPEVPVDITMAIYDCKDLERVIVKCPEPYSLGKGTFMGCNQENCILIVPDGSAEAYSSASGWKNFDRIIESSQAAVDPVINSGKNYTVAIHPGALHIAAYENEVYIFSADGKKINSVRPHSDDTICLPAGIYIISDRVTAEKIIIP